MYHYEVISDEYRFEEFIQDLFNAKYLTQSFQLYKLKGAAQHGIDVFSTEKRTVIQCKKKDVSRIDKKLKEELIKDFNESLQCVEQLPFDFDVFILATTTKKYTTVQDHAAKLSQSKPFDVQFLSWRDIERLIHQYQKIRDQYYPHLVATKSSSVQNPKIKTISQTISNSSISGTVHQIGGDLHITTNKMPDIKTLPPPESIGGNPLLKQSIISRFNKLGEEREKRFGKSAYPAMYANFKRDFGIKERKWTKIWEWPEVCAEQIIRYLDDKYNNTKAGRIEKAATRPGYIHKRPYLFKREKEFLSQLELDIKSQEVKHSLQEYFGVTSHKNLTNLQHWQWVCYLEKEVDKIYEKD